MQINLNIIAYNNYVDSALAIVLDIFRMANVVLSNRNKELRFKTNIVGVDEDIIVSKSGMRIAADLGIESLSTCHAVLFSGPWVESGKEIDAVHEEQAAKKIIQKLRQADWGETILAASCSDVAFLAASGLLNGHQATTNWWLASYFKQKWPLVSFSTREILVQSDNIITAGAVFSQINLSLRILSHFGTERLSKECANLLLLRQFKYQTDHIDIRHLSASDDIVLRAEKWVRINLSRKFEIGELTNFLGIGSRTFSRRLKQCLGMTPIAFVQRMRVERAIELLKTTELTIQEISFAVGYNNVGSLSKLLKKQTSKTAGALRGIESKNR